MGVLLIIKVLIILTLGIQYSVRDIINQRQSRYSIFI